MTGNTSATISNFWNNIPDFPCEKEITDCLLNNKSCKIERIVSYGQFSPADFWFDQSMNEWIILLEGYSEIEFNDINEPFILNKGDFLFIPAHQKHRIIKTSIEKRTVWLTVFFSDYGQ